MGWSHHRCLLWSTCRTTQGQETAQTKVQSTCTYSGEPSVHHGNPQQHNCLLNPNPKNSGPLSCSTMPFWAVSEFLLLHTWHYSFKQLLYTNFPSCKKNIQATLKVSTREQGCSRWHVFDFGTRKWRKWDQVIFRGSLISMRVESEHSPVCADWRRAAE